MGPIALSEGSLFLGSSDVIRCRDLSIAHMNLVRTHFTIEIAQHFLT